MILRVFPRRTKATPIDKYSFIGDPGLFIPEDIKEIHISCAFTWDIPEAERLYKSWCRFGKTKIGGPAFNKTSGDFIPGRYLKPGYVITSRGCPNRCWFCSVWRREPQLKELKIKNGYDILDDNLLACSQEHINAVFKMLFKQKDRVRFTGGLEAARLENWHIELLLKLKPKPLIFFAYDTESDYEPLLIAAEKLKQNGFNRHSLMCYCLIGYLGDTFDKAEKRLKKIMELGLVPFAMLYRDNHLIRSRDWGKFQKYWARPWYIYSSQKLFYQRG
jgi:hypothetical protein